MATPASRKPRERKTFWQRFLSSLIPPWIQVAAVILCSGIVYLAELWVQPDRARLKAEKQSSQIIRNQLLDLEKKLPQEREQDLRHGILADVAPTLLQMMGLVQPLEMTGKSLIL